MSYLIDQTTKQWHTDLVDGLFVEEDVELIKKIPLSKTVKEDVLYWPYSSNGEYRCKTGYRFLKEEAKLTDTERVPPLRNKKLGYASAVESKDLYIEGLPQCHTDKTSSGKKNHHH